MEENKDGCIFCRGEIPYVLCDGATLDINKNGDVLIIVSMINAFFGADNKIVDRIFGKDKYQEHEPTRFISINATSLFDCCPACGKSLGKNYPIDLDYSLITANKNTRRAYINRCKRAKANQLRGGTNG